MKNGRLSQPDRFLPCLISTFLSAITQLRLTLSITTESCMSMQFFTTLPLPIVTPRNMTLFSTTPSITHPSAINEFLTFASLRYDVGAESFIFV